MARPITWQDVAAPNLTGSLAASQAAGNQITQALGNLGQLGMDLRDQARADATGRAIAGILSSDDPAAALAAAPQDWSVDPLALATAANARSTDLLNTRNTNLSINRNQAVLDDIISSREAEAIAQRNWDASRKAGVSTFVGDDAGGTSQAHVKAGAIIEDRLNRLRDDARADSQLEISRDLARMNKAAFERNKALDAARGQVFEYAQSDRGLLDDPSTRQRTVTDIVTGNNLPAYLASQLMTDFNNGLQGSLPTEQQLDTNDARGRNYRGVVNDLNTQKALIESNKNTQLSRLSTALEAAALEAVNPYKGLTRGSANKAFLERNKQVTQGWGPNWSNEDVEQRVDAIKDYAKKQGVPLDDYQAYSMVENTIGEFTPFDGASAINDSVRAQVALFGSLNSNGGLEEVRRKEAAIQTNAEKAAAKVDRAINETYGAARSGRTVSGLGADIYDRSRPTQAFPEASIVESMLKNLNTRQ